MGPPPAGPERASGAAGPADAVGAAAALRASAAPLVVAAALRLEARVLRSALPGARVVRTGMGPARARAVAGRWASEVPGAALAVAGLCAGLDPRLRPGDVVVASEVRGPDGASACPSAGSLVAALARRGLRAHLGPLLSVDHLVRGHERARLHAGGAIAADMESAFLAAAGLARPRGRGEAAPLAVLRVVVDASGRELWRAGMAVDGLRALRALRRAAPALADWAAGVVETKRFTTPKEVG
jgi:4-hydroxy-3-methylbut-2-enyl diphosphate reductase